ncbi:MAG: SDR family oxidoreductase [Clostridia bacterium]|nr:SDR family oxidoreductase [Clostridia bacterium]
MQKKVLVTGASGGIGRRVVEVLSSEYLVLAQYRTHADRVPVGENVVPLYGDFSDPMGVEAFWKEVKKFGTLYGVVHCAGVAKSGLFSDFSDREIEDLTFRDLTAPMLLTKRLIPGMVERKSGSIVLVSSIWGVCGGSLEVAYSAAKGGLISFCKALAKELGPSGVRVNCVAPGFIETEMTAMYSAADKAAFCDGLALGRPGTPDDVAGMIKFLLSDESSYVTAQVLGVDGGY